MSATVLYMAHGSDAIVRQTVYSYLSMLRVDRDRAPKVRIYTDRPAAFGPLAGRVELVELDAKETADWVEEAKGYRNIVKCRILSRLRERFVFLDSDTVVVHSLNELAARLRPDVAFMHRREYRLKDRPDTAGALSDPKVAPVAADMPMWNSGLMAVHEALAPQLAGAPDLALHLRLAHGIRPAEQLADAILLARKATIQPAFAWIVHYWQDKTAFQRRIDAALADADWSELAARCVEGREGRLFALGLDATAAGHAMRMKIREWRERFGGRPGPWSTA